MAKDVSAIGALRSVRLLLQGIDTASGGRLLDGFSRWLVEGRETSIHWSGQIERQITGRDDGSAGESDMVRRLPDEASAQCVAALFAALQAFLAKTAS